MDDELIAEILGDSFHSLLGVFSSSGAGYSALQIFNDDNNAVRNDDSALVLDP